MLQGVVTQRSKSGCYSPVLLCLGSSYYRLVNPNNFTGSQYYGRVELLHDGKWGTVCNTSWTFQNALVVCKALDFPSAEQFYTAGTSNPGTGKIWLNHVACEGTEYTLESCSHDDWNNVAGCTHANDIGVICSDSKQVLPSIVVDVSIE